MFYENDYDRPVVEKEVNNDNMAMQYVPEDKKKEIRAKICEDCKYNDREEQLSCCWCQEGSMFEEKPNKKLPRGNRRRLQIIEQSSSDCNLDGGETWSLRQAKE